MTKLTVLSVAALLLGGILGGCSDSAPVENNSTEPTSSIEGGTVVFANDKGEPMFQEWCSSPDCRGSCMTPM